MKVGNSHRTVVKFEVQPCKNDENPEATNAKGSAQEIVMWEEGSYLKQRRYHQSNSYASYMLISASKIYHS